MPAPIDERGHKHGLLKVFGESGRSKSGDILWRAHCVCGGIILATGGQLRSGKTWHCGCQEQPRIKGRFAKKTRRLVHAG